MNVSTIELTRDEAKELAETFRKGEKVSGAMFKRIQEAIATLERKLEK